jgi:hypothetical protein
MMIKRFSALPTLVTFAALVSTVCANRAFPDVSSQVGFVLEEKKSKGNPVWGDFNNDGILDLIVPCHGLSLSHGPFVYLGKSMGCSPTSARPAVLVI